MELQHVSSFGGMALSSGFLAPLCFMLHILHRKLARQVTNHHHSRSLMPRLLPVAAARQACTTTNNSCCLPTTQLCWTATELLLLSSGFWKGMSRWRYGCVYCPCDVKQRLHWPDCLRSTNLALLCLCCWSLCPQHQCQAALHRLLHRSHILLKCLTLHSTLASSNCGWCIPFTGCTYCT